MRHGATAGRFLDAEVAVFEEGTQPFGLELRAGGPGAAEGHSSPVLGVPDIGFRCSRHDGSPSEIVFCCTVRSEEHTSELQSLMRISYAVFCLKKKKLIR